jgi:thiosulfate dehydrogenase
MSIFHSFAKFLLGGLAIVIGSTLLSASERKDNSDYVYGVPAVPSKTWMLSAGGRLYDNWMTALGLEGPNSTHPAWPSSNKKKTGNVTWRCKSCHGWDGVRGVVGRDPAEITKLLSDSTHGFTDDMIPPQAKDFVAWFLSAGLHKTEEYISADGTVKGDAERGAAIFQNTCVACHGYDGRTLNWGEEGSPDYVGTEAKANPWEVLHKIRNGHAGHNMISLRAFSMQDAVNVLAYAQTLPNR